MPLSLAARYGLHRVLDGDGTFPQPAWKLDADPRISDAEILVDVERLNLDSASFRQLASDAGGDPAGVARAIEAIVAERGKLHNPVTGSGGMLLGRVARVGSALAELGSPLAQLAVGDRVATLMGKSAELVTVILAIWRLGAVYVPLFTAFAPQAIALRLEGSGTRVVIADPDQRHKLVVGPDMPEDPHRSIVRIPAARTASAERVGEHAWRVHPDLNC